MPDLPAVPSLALGTGEVTLLELTSAYGAFAHRGLLAAPVMIQRVEDPIRASFFGSTIVARGAVVRSEDVKGRRISLDVMIENGRIEDLLKLAVKAPKTPLTGRVAVKTKMLLSAGERDVVERLQLDGQFSLVQARFTSFDVQKRINTLSRRGRRHTVHALSVTPPGGRRERVAAIHPMRRAFSSQPCRLNT